MSNSMLSQIFEFTSDDLDYNRDGLLSPRQIAKFKRGMRMGAALGFIFFGIFFVMTIFVTRAFSSFTLIGAIVWGTIAVVLGYVELNYLLRIIFPKVPSLKSVTGHLVRGNPTRKGRDRFEVEVNGEAFHLNQAALTAFETEKAYTFYLSTEDKSLISVEEATNISSLSEKSLEQIATEKSQSLYNFSPMDLVFNRNGRLSQSQLEQRRAALQNNWGCMGLSLVIAISIGGAMLGILNNLLYSGIGVLVVFLTLVILTFNSTCSQLKALENVKVLAARGIAMASIGSHRTGGKNSQTIADYYISLGDKRFHLPQIQYYAFKEGHSYTLYYTENNGSLDIVAAILEI